MKLGAGMCMVMAAAAAAATPAVGQSGSDVARASNPQGLMAILEASGHKPKLTKDGSGDPMIELDLDGYKGLLMFYGCDEAKHDNCQSLQLQAGLDAKEALPPEKALDISRQYRFASVHLDDEGDPWVKWDIITGQGIPQSVFLESVSSFSDVVTQTADIVFEEE